MNASVSLEREDMEVLTQAKLGRSFVWIHSSLDRD